MARRGEITALSFSHTRTDRERPSSRPLGQNLRTVSFLSCVSKREKLPNPPGGDCVKCDIVQLIHGRAACNAPLFTTSPIWMLLSLSAEGQVDLSKQNRERSECSNTAAIAPIARD